MIWTIVETVEGESKIALGLTREDVQALFHEDRYAALTLPVLPNWKGNIIIFGGETDEDILRQLPQLGSTTIFSSPKTGQA